MNKKMKLVWFLVIPLLAAALFLPLFENGAVLFTTDDNIAYISKVSNLLPKGYLGSWDSQELLGKPFYVSRGLTGIITYFLTPVLFTNLIHAIDLTIASFFLFLFLREHRVSPLAALLGIITAYWLGTNFTLTYAGHMMKFGVLLFASVALYCLAKARHAAKPLVYFILCGIGCAFMMMEQQDCAILFGIIILCYAVFVLFQIRTSVVRGILTLLAIGSVAGAISLSSNLRVLGENVGSGSPDEPPKSRSEKWDFATQWSFPPDEMVTMMAPGYMGWRSNEPTGPYWGRVGQQPGWETTRQGFRNFILESPYVGIIPFLMCAFAIYGIFYQKEWSPDRKERLFWTAMVALTLMLAFGRFFPLYKLFFQLPVVHNIRNPNKFLQVFQVALGILTALGMESLMSAAHASQEQNEHV